MRKNLIGVCKCEIVRFDVANTFKVALKRIVATIFNKDTTCCIIAHSMHNNYGMKFADREAVI